MTFDKIWRKGYKKHTWLPETSTFIKNGEGYQFESTANHDLHEKDVSPFPSIKEIVGFRVPGTSRHTLTLTSEVATEKSGTPEMDFFVCPSKCREKATIATGVGKIHSGTSSFLQSGSKNKF